MLRLWKAILLVNLALAVGVGVGYLRWGYQAGTRRSAGGVEQREAAARGWGSWTVRGIVRAVLPDLGALLVTHEAIPGLMPGMTMGFEVADPRLLAGLTPGDPIQLTLLEKNQRLLLIAIERAP